MKLYKMRSLNNFEFVVDLILNERLYCAHYSSLDDPFEGIYLSVTHLPPLLLQKKGTQRVSLDNPSRLYEQEKFCRICSLSGSFEDLRLWSQYAEGHKGIAIEIDFKGHETDVVPVRYLEELKKYSNTVLGAPFPEEVLSQKTIHWVHEREFRILQSDEYYPVKNRITAIYLGQRVSENHKALLEKLVPKDIPMYATKIDETTLKVKPNTGPNRMRTTTAPPISRFVRQPTEEK